MDTFGGACDMVTQVTQLLLLNHTKFVYQCYINKINFKCKNKYDSSFKNQRIVLHAIICVMPLAAFFWESKILTSV